MGVKGSPNLDHFTLLVVPQVIETKCVREPIKLLSSLTDERENPIFVVHRYVHL